MVPLLPFFFFTKFRKKKTALISGLKLTSFAQLINVNARCSLYLLSVTLVACYLFDKLTVDFIFQFRILAAGLK